MPARVTLIVTQSENAGQEFVFDERTTCIVGRSQDCYPRLMQKENPRTVSRHHCLMDINPPDIRIRDFGSLNGTLVNGQLIGRREKHQSKEEGVQLNLPEHDLKDGDEIRIRETVFRVSIYVPTVCDQCSAEIPDEQLVAAKLVPGVFPGAACRGRAKMEIARVPSEKTTRQSREMRQGRGGRNRRASARRLCLWLVQVRSAGDSQRPCWRRPSQVTRIC